MSVPTYRETVLAEHISNGWNKAQLAYNLAVAGFDCRHGLFENYGGSTWAFVDRPNDSMTIANTHVFGFGEKVLGRLPVSLSVCERGVSRKGELPSIIP